MRTSGGLLQSASADWFDAAPFINGETAMQWTGLWTLPDVQDELGDDFDVLPFPAIGAAGRQAVPFGAYASASRPRASTPMRPRRSSSGSGSTRPTDQVDFANAYGTHIPAQPALVAKADKIATGPGASAAKFVDDLGHAPDKLWTSAISQAMVGAVTNVAIKNADPEDRDRQGRGQGEDRDRPRQRLTPRSVTSQMPGARESSTAGS